MNSSARRALDCICPTTVLPQPISRTTIRPDLTEPLADPESYYVRPEDWQRFGPVRRGILQVNRCLAGRMLIAPLFFTLGLIRHDLRLIARGDRPILRAWLLHLATVPVVLVLVIQSAAFPSGSMPWPVTPRSRSSRSVPSWNIAPGVRSPSGASSSNAAASSVFYFLTIICMPCIMRRRRCRGTGCLLYTAANAIESCGVTADMPIPITAR